MGKFILITVAVLLIGGLPALALVAQGPAGPGDIGFVLGMPGGPDAPTIITGAGLTEIWPVAAPLGAFVLIQDQADLNALSAHGAVAILQGETLLELCLGQQ